MGATKRSIPDDDTDTPRVTLLRRVRELEDALDDAMQRLGEVSEERDQAVLRAEAAEEELRELQKNTTPCAGQRGVDSNAPATPNTQQGDC